jgi:hypothetical protein
MTIATVTIKDEGEGYTIEGSLDRPEAIEEAPTPALIIATYLSANIAKVCEDAIQWYNDMGAQNDPGN